jgi:photosystem II stability/assembly factor-like uncharacterized protein
MKNLLAILLLAALAGWAGAARGQVAPSTVLGTGPEEFTVNAFAFSAGEKPTALAVGENGLILASDDGGASWEQRRSGTAAHLAAVAFADELTAYAVGGGTLGAGNGSVGVILKADNGGLTWKPVGPSVTASGGLATGRFWGVAARGSAVVAWCAPGPDVPSGMVLGSNGGKSWAALGGRVTALPVAARWTDDDGGYAITADGVGWQWSTSGVKRLEGQSPPGRLTAAQIVDGENWVAAIEGGGIWATKDGGRKWRATDGDAPLGCRGFSFYESTEGWCNSVGPDGPRFTTNGGKTWKRPAELPPGPVRAVCFRDAWNGVAAGPFGTIYRTTDGGGTWKSVRGAPRRAGLIIFEPWGSVGDWPLVSMLCGDRGYRTLIWSATMPADESVIEAERKLRDAAEALDGSEAIVLGTERTARHDGSPGFVWPATLPHGEFAGKDPAGLRAVLMDAERSWRPTVVLSPSEKSEEPEEAFVGKAARHPPWRGGETGEGHPAGVGASPSRMIFVVWQWAADPRNAAGTRPAGAEGEYEVAVNPLAPSENFGASHAVRAVMAAQLVRQWPAPLAEALGYHRVSGKKAGPLALSLLEDLERGGEETRRAIPATAVYGLAQRADWERETAAFYTAMRAEVERGEFAAARQRTEVWGMPHLNFQLPQTVLMELARRAAVGGDARTANEIFLQATVLAAPWGPRRAEALEWVLDRQAAPEWPLAAEKSADPLLGGLDYGSMFDIFLNKLFPEVARRADLQFERYRWLAMQGKVDEAALKRARTAAEASDDAVFAATVQMETWIQGGRRGEIPVAAVSLSKGAVEQTVDLGPKMALAVREEAGGLTLEFDEKAAQGAWVTIDLGRTGRTALAEPVVEAEAPRVAKKATAGSPLWVRNAALWTRTEKDGKVVLRLGYAALGGRPQRGTVWLVTVRRETIPGLRPQVWAELKNGGCFAVMFD